MRKTGKREWSSRDWFWFDIWLVKRVAWFFFDQSQSEVKPEHCNYGLFPTLNENLLLCDLKVYLRIFWNFRNCHCDFGVQCIVSGTVVSFTRPADLGQEKTPRWLVGRWTTGTGIIRTPCTFCFFIYVMSRGGLMIMSLYFRLETLSSRLNEVIVFSLIANLSTTTQCS